jgi:hypothetical protein
VVTLNSSSPGNLTVPATVTILAGAATASFNATPVDNALQDGARPVTITASASGLTGDTHDIAVLDDEVHHFTIDPIASPQFTAAPISVTVRALSIDNQPVTTFTGTAALSAGAAVVTPSVTEAFTAGVWTGNIIIAAPTTGIVLTATTAGGANGSSNAFDVQQGPRLAIAPASLSVDIPLGEPAVMRTLYLTNPGLGTTTWNVSVIGGSWLTVTPANGSVPEGDSGSVTVTMNPAGLTLGTHAATLRFTSNDPSAPQQDIPVTLNATAAVHHFEWNIIPSPQVANVPFAAIVTAKDNEGNTLAGFEGSTRLFLLGPVQEAASGTESGQLAYPFWSSSNTEFRTQYIYLPGEVGGAGRIQQIAFYQSNPQGSLDNLVIRLKHTTKADYTAQATWESTGWTVVYQNNQPATTAGGWMALNLNTPFEYDGVQNLMVDVSFDNVTTTTSSAAWASSNRGSRILRAGTTANSSGNPLSWSGTSPTPSVNTSLTNIRFTRRESVPVSPSQVSFTGGTWSGNLAAQSSGTALSAVATHVLNTSLTGSSNTFDVTSAGSLSLSIPASGTEGGTLDGTVTASVAPASNLTVTLASSDTTEAVPSASATILAGQTSAAFTINLPEDALLDGSQSVVISATAPGYNRGQAPTANNDNESTTVTLTLPATLTEGSSSTAGQASVQLATPAAADLTISLVSSLASRLTVPASVVIPAGQSSTAFTLTAPNNTIIDGNQDTMITATLTGSSPATGTVQVTDNESRVLSFTLFTTSTSEGGAPSTTAGYITLAAATASPLTINLTSSDISELTVSSTVTIAAGSSASGFFTLTPVNDALIDGTQAVTLTATAATFTSATSSAISVLDDDVHHFALSAVASPQVRNAPFNITFTAKDINDTTITTYAGSPLLTAADGAASISVTPGTLTGFSSGVKTQTVSVGNDATNAVLTITDPGTGGNGSSNAFVVGLGALHHFGVSTIPASITQGQPQPVTVTAQDQGNNTIPSFTQTADLAISRDLQNTDTGASSGTWSLPLGSLGRSQRTQVIYLPVEVGPARPLHRLSLNVSTLPGSSLSNFTIRLKHTNKSNYSGAGTVQWESTGWTTVHQSTATISTTGWKQFVFTAPFMYDGSSPLMIDFSYYNAGSGSVEGNTYYTNSGAVRTVLAESYSDYGSPLAWSGSTNPVPITNNAVPTVRFGTDAASVPVSPVVTGAFENGQWSGVFTPGGTGVSVSLRATNGTTTGASPPFTVIAQPNLAVSLPTTAVESAGLVAGTVSLNAAVGTDTTVTLASSAPAQAAPAASSVTIPAGSTSASFNLSIVDDTLPEGDQVVTITATSPGVMAGVANVTVLDNDPHHFAFNAVGTQVRGVPFNITVTAQSSTNAALSGFTGTVNFSAAAGVSPVTITPTASGAFASGVWTGTMTVSQAANNVALTASDAAGHTGTSSLFNVSSGPASRFQWTAQPSHVVPGTAFPVTITAVDAYGDTATSFASTANLGVINPETSTTTIGAGLFASTVPLYTFQADCRGQVIYKRSEVGPARRITGLALNISTTSSFIYNNFTLRLRHTTLGNFNSSPAWESTDWTVAWQGNHTFSTSGWTTFTFTTPFDYNGTDNLMVDISTDNTTSGSGAWLRRDPTGYDVGMVYQYGASYGAPTSWSGATPPISSAIERPQIRFLGNPGITITPAVTGTFVNGSWSGNLTVNSTHPAIVLQAVGGGGISGASAPVHSGFVAPSFSAEPAFTGGIANTLSWSASPGSATYALERDTLNTFTSPFILSDLPSTSTAISGLQDGTQYHYRVRGISNASVPASLGEWQQTSFADFNTAAHSNTSAYLSLHDVTLAASGTSPTTWTENFEASGTSWASTIFSATGGAATMDRQIMSSGPNTSPALPVNQNGDMEGRIGNDSGTSTGYAFMPATAANTFQDGSIEGYLAPEGATSYLYGTLLLRASLSATNGIQGYAAFANFGPSNVTFSVQVMLNGILNTLATSGSISYTATDNFKMRLNAQGNSLTLQVWRVSVIGGVVTETPLAINGSNTSINVTDTTFNTGRAALYFTAASGRCYFDDITVTNNSPVFVPSGTATSPVIAPAYKQNWGTLSYQLDTSSPGASASVDVLDFNGNLLAANVASGTDLATFPAISASSSLKLRANMSSTNAASTPYLRSWTLGYVLSSAAPLTSPWSNTVSSTQDASPPALSIPDLTTANASATLTGTATDATSGVSGVTVGGNAATTANAFTNWTRNVTGLADGSNSITVTASDNAVPPNTANVTAIVYRIAAPTGDPNNDGINSLLEHALGIPSGAANPRSMLPAATIQTDSGTGAKYLSMQFRRRIQRSGLAYTVETSTNLSNWDDTGASVQEMSVTPTGDGVTEAVTVRVTPAMSASNTKGYVRLRITTN